MLACSISVSCRQSQNSLNTAGKGKTPQKTEPNDVVAAKKIKSTEAARLTEADKANTGRVWVSHLYVRLWYFHLICIFGECCLLCRWSLLCFGSTWRLSAFPCPSSVSFCSSVIICPLWAQTTGSVSGQMTLLSTTHSPTETCVYRCMEPSESHKVIYETFMLLFIIAYIPILNSFNMTTCIQCYIASSTKILDLLVVAWIHAYSIVMQCTKSLWN